MPVAVLAVQPPGEVGDQHVERPLQERQRLIAEHVAVEVVVEQRRPRVHGRIDVVEVPLVRGQLAVRVLIAIKQHQAQLLLSELGIQPRDRRRVEGEVPGGEPGVLPLVRHRDHVGAEHVKPVLIAALVGRCAFYAALGEPFLHVVDVGLLGPEQTGCPLPENRGGVGAERLRRMAGVERIGLALALREDRVERRHRIVQLLGRARAQAQAHRGGLAGVDVDQGVRRRLGPLLGRVHRVAPPLDDVVVDSVLLVGRRIGLTPQAIVVGLVVSEQQLARPLAIEEALAQRRVARGDDRRPGVVHRFELGAGCLVADPPGVTKPEVRHQVQRRRLGTPVDGADADQDVLGIDLGKLDDDVEVAILIEDPGVEQLELEILARAPPVLAEQLLVGVRPLRILVEHLRVRMGGRAVEIEVVLLDVLAVIALAVGEPEHSLLEDRVLAVPQREREAEQHVVVAEPGDAVLAAVVSARARLIVGEVVPGFDRAVGVLANAAPLPFAEVRAPFSPGHTVARFLEPFFFPGLLGHAPQGGPAGADTPDPDRTAYRPAARRPAQPSVPATATARPWGEPHDFPRAASTARRRRVAASISLSASSLMRRAALR